MTCVVARGGASGLRAAIPQLGLDGAGRAVVLVRLSPPTPAAAGVVHEVVDLLLERGCEEVVVGSALRSGDRDRGHHAFEALAAGAGLAGVTTRGRRYQVADLATHLIPAPVPESAVLHGRPVSAQWVQADVRVVLARAVTDLVDGYAGCLDTLLGAAPPVTGADPADVAAELAAFLPPTLAVVDATVTAAGTDGARLPHLCETDTVVAATDARTADGALAALLGMDRSASRLLVRAREVLGDPTTGRTEGPLTPLLGIRSAHPLCRRAARTVAEDTRLERVLRAATGGPDLGARDVGAAGALAAVRALVTPLVERADRPEEQSGLLALLTATGAAVSAGRARDAALAKDRIPRRVVPLGFDPAAFDDEDYDRLPGFVAPFERLLADAPETGDGFRWRTVDGATVFETSRDIPADFEEFVARVDVAAGISLMADYVGGRRVVLGSTGGGAIRQAERNLYLPQPNYLAAWGGAPIDVCKIELVERDDDRHRLTWRTVHSPNGSAECDDGSLTFTRSATGTLATVRGRQLFTVPPAVQALDLDAVPELRTPLLEDAYRRFFTTTFDNLEACFENRPFRIGRPPPEPDEPLLTDAADLYFAMAREWLGDRAGSAPDTRTATEPSGPVTDAHGFQHFRGPR